MCTGAWRVSEIPWSWNYSELQSPNVSHRNRTPVLLQSSMWFWQLGHLSSPRISDFYVDKMEEECMKFCWTWQLQFSLLTCLGRVLLSSPGQLFTLEPRLAINSWWFSYLSLPSDGSQSWVIILELHFHLFWQSIYSSAHWFMLYFSYSVSTVLNIKP